MKTWFITGASRGFGREWAEAALDRALAEFLETGVDPEQLDRIKMQARASEIYARDSVDSLANRYGRALTQGLTIGDVQEWPDVLQAVTAEDVMAAARAVFDRRGAQLGPGGRPRQREPYARRFREKSIY